MHAHATPQPSAVHARALLERVVDELDQADPDVDHALALVSIAAEELEKFDASATSDPAIERHVMRRQSSESR